jgi:hypothetical protein
MDVEVPSQIPIIFQPKQNIGDFQGLLDCPIPARARACFLMMTPEHMRAVFIQRLHDCLEMFLATSVISDVPT